jgi:ankyrin repeat protein
MGYMLRNQNQNLGLDFDLDEALIIATAQGNANNVRRLLNYGADPSVNNNQAIRIASEIGNAEIVDILLQDYRTDPGAEDNQAICDASYAGHIEVVELLLSDPRVDPSADDNYPIRYASQNGHAEIVQMLLEDERVNPGTGGAEDADDIFYQTNYPIIIASENGHAVVVALLLDSGDERVNPAVDGNQPILTACTNGRTEVVRVLLSDPRVNPAVDNNEPIRSASEFGHYEVVQLLLNDPRVNPIDQNHRALEFASENRLTEQGTLQVVKLLVEWNAEHGIPIEDFFDLLIPQDRKYILMYYDINSIDEDTYDFELNQNNPMHRRFVDYLLTSYGTDYTADKRARLLRIVGFDPNTVSQTTSALQSVNIPSDLYGTIGEFLI